MSIDHDRTLRGAARGPRASLKASLLRAVVATLLAVFASGPAFASAGAGAAAAPAPTTTEETAPRTATPTTTPRPDDEAQRYAARERAASGLEHFAGGDGVGIYIGSGALLVALIVVIALLVI